MSFESEEIPLVRAIVTAPDDDLPRLVYADWLEHHAHSDRARLIRVQCMIEQLRAEEKSLLDQFGKEWSADVSVDGAYDWAFHRGFPEELTLRFQDFMANHERLNKKTPLARIRLVGSLTDNLDGDLEAFARLPVVQQIRALEIGSKHLDPTHPTCGVKGVRALAKSPYLTGLKDLTLYSSRIGLEGITEIANSEGFKELTQLAVTDPACSADEHCLLQLVRSPHLPNLEKVQLGDSSPCSVRNIRAIASVGNRSRGGR